MSDNTNCKSCCHRVQTHTHKRLTKGKGSSDDSIGHGDRKEDVGELSEWRFQNEKQGGGHDEPQLVHGQVVMNPVQQKVEKDGNIVIRKVVVEVEEETVKHVFKNGPHDASNDPREAEKDET